MFSPPRLTPARAVIAAAVATAAAIAVAPFVDLDLALDRAPSRPSVHAQGAAAKVTVIGGSAGGSGSGMFAPGSPVYIEPFRLPDSRVFDRWTVEGTGADVERRTARTTFTMPAGPITLTAGVRSTPLWGAARETVAGVDIAFHLPEHPRAVLVLFHDAGGGLSSWLLGTEERQFMRDAVAAGYGVLAIDSADRGTGRWNLTATRAANIDLQNVHAVLEALATRGDMDQAPHIAVGFGRGGTFATLAAEDVEMAAAVIFAGVGLESVMAATRVPTFFALAERDSVTDNAAARAQHDALRARGVASEIVVHAPNPVVPTRFWPITSFTMDDSKTVHASLLDAGVIDAGGTLLRHPKDVDIPLLIPADVRSAVDEVRAQLVVSYAEHAFFSDADDRVLGFLDGLSRPALTPTPESTRRAYAAHVKVTNGSKSLGPMGPSREYYSDRDIVQIWADPDPAGQVFDRWRASAFTRIENPAERHSRFMVLSGSEMVTATYRAAPEWDPAPIVVGDRDVQFHSPRQPIGVVYFFHGRGGSAAGWVARRAIENRLLLNDAVARGYAIVVPESLDRAARQWSPVANPANNPDVQHVAQVQEALIARGLLPAGLPAFGVGMSNGGAFVSRVAAALGFGGAAVYCAGAPPAVIETTTVPTIWLLAENDRRISNNDAVAMFVRLRGRGVPAELHVNPPSPVYPERFWRIPGVTREVSQEVYDVLRSGGYLDRLEYLKRDPAETDWAAALAASPVDVRLQGPVAAQLDAAWAAHQFFGDFNDRTLGFFDRIRTGTFPTPTATPTRTPPATGTPTATVIGPPTPLATPTATVATPGRPTPTLTPSPVPDGRGKAFLPWADGAGG